MRGFLAYQEEAGVSLEELGTRDGSAPPRSTASTRSTRSSAARSARRISGAARARTLGDDFDLDRLRELYFERLDPNEPMIELMRELRERGLRMALLTNNVREWEPLWRAKLPELDEIFEVVVDSAFVGHAQARAARSTSSRSSGSGTASSRASACSSTTST